MKNIRWRCQDCGQVRFEHELLTAKSPFDSEQTIVACPGCRSIDHFRQMCDESGCKQDATCGFPTDGVYRSTCGDHYRQYNGKGVGK